MEGGAFILWRMGDDEMNFFTTTKSMFVDPNPAFRIKYANMGEGRRRRRSS
jgi:hypothetical protein